LFVTPYLFNERFYIYVTIKTISTLFSYAWDIKIDFYLLDSKESGKYGLRNTMAYAPWFYYFATVENFILRFWWIISLFEWS